MRRTGVACVLTFVAALALGSLGPATAVAQRRILFDQTVKIPFALELGSKVLKPGKYVLKMESDRGTPTMLFETTGGAGLGRVTGQHIERIPEKDRDLKKDTRLQILPMPNPEDPDRRSITFLFDWKSAMGTEVYRWVFRVPEAAKKKK